MVKEKAMIRFIKILFLILLLLLTYGQFTEALSVIRGGVATPREGRELVADGGFEIAGSGPPWHVFADWSSILGAGAMIQTLVAGEFRSGLAAVKMTTGVGANTHLYHSFPVVPGTTYFYQIWTRSETIGGVEGRYGIYDWINFAFIVPLVGTGVTNDTYMQISGLFVAPAGCTWAGFYLYCPLVVGKITWFDDVSAQESP